MCRLCWRSGMCWNGPAPGRFGAEIPSDVAWWFNRRNDGDDVQCISGFTV